MAMTSGGAGVGAQVPFPGAGGGVGGACSRLGWPLTTTRAETLIHWTFTHGGVNEQPVTTI